MPLLEEFEKSHNFNANIIIQNLGFGAEELAEIDEDRRERVAPRVRRTVARNNKLGMSVADLYFEKDDNLEPSLEKNTSRNDSNCLDILMSKPHSSRISSMPPPESSKPSTKSLNFPKFARSGTSAPQHSSHGSTDSTAHTSASDVDRVLKHIVEEVPAGWQKNGELHTVKENDEISELSHSSQSRRSQKSTASEEKDERSKQANPRHSRSLPTLEIPEGESPAGDEDHAMTDPLVAALQSLRSRPHTHRRTRDPLVSSSHSTLSRGRNPRVRNSGGRKPELPLPSKHTRSKADAQNPSSHVERNEISKESRSSCRKPRVSRSCPSLSEKNKESRHSSHGKSRRGESRNSNRATSTRKERRGEGSSSSLSISRRSGRASSPKGNDLEGTKNSLRRRHSRDSLNLGSLHSEKSPDGTKSKPLRRRPSRDSLNSRSLHGSRKMDDPSGKPLGRRRFRDGLNSASSHGDEKTDKSKDRSKDKSLRRRRSRSSGETETELLDLLRRGDEKTDDANSKPLHRRHSRKNLDSEASEKKNGTEESRSSKSSRHHQRSSSQHRPSKN